MNEERAAPRAASNRTADRRPVPPSGEQYTIAWGSQEAVVVEVGGGVRQYRVDGQDVLDGYPVDQRSTGARGLPLVPWPNRIGDGRYRFDGEEYQLSLSEPEKHNAIHGLLRWRSWPCRLQEQHRVVMGTVLHPMMGYPFTLDVSVEYRLGEDGLTVVTTARNVGDRPCPFGSGQHPYLTLGTDLVDDWILTLDAATRLPTDEQGLPTGREPAAGSVYDFCAGRVIGTQDVDTTFTDLARDEGGRAWVRVSAPGRRTVALWADESYPFIEIYTSHTQPAPHWRHGLGVEPMTCPPNAFRTGENVIRLQPGESAVAAWGLQLAPG